MSTPVVSTGTSSIDTGLSATPDLTNVQSVGALSYQLITIYNAINILAQAIDAYTGNAPENTETPNQPAEATVIVGNMANFFCNAAVDLGAGFLVTLESVGGVTNAKLADASLGLAGIAHGLTMGTATAGSPIQILLLGLFNFGGGPTAGVIYYLSDTNPGDIIATKPTAAGSLVQAIGFGIDTDSMWISPSLTPTVN